MNVQSDLLSAVTGNRIEAVRAILQEHPTLNLNTRNVLHWAVTSNKEEMTSLLIAAGANVNALGMAGNDTPLSIAITRNHLKIANILLKSEADPNRSSPLAGPPLMKALTVEAVQLLLQYKADPNCTDSKGQTCLIKIITYHRWEVAKILIAAGANVNSTDQHGYTPLIYAVEKELEPAVMLLLEAGADVSIALSSGRTALDIAANKPNIQRIIEKHRLQKKGATFCTSEQPQDSSSGGTNGGSSNLKPRSAFSFFGRSAGKSEAKPSTEKVHVASAPLAAAVAPACVKLSQNDGLEQPSSSSHTKHMNSIMHTTASTGLDLPQETTATAVSTGMNAIGTSNSTIVNAVAVLASSSDAAEGGLCCPQCLETEHRMSLLEQQLRTQSALLQQQASEIAALWSRLGKEG